MNIHTTGLLDLADSYCEAELKNICCRLIWQRVTVDNVATLVAIATKYKVEVRISSDFTSITYGLCYEYS